MRGNRVELFVHLVWGTWDRLPLITPDVERSLYRCIESTAQQHGCTTIALGGIEDHVHFLATMPATISVADLVKLIKGTSSHFVADQVRPGSFFKWQGSYGAFSVSRSHTEKVADYIRRQKEHHKTGNLIQAFEAVFADHPADKTS